MQYTLRNIPTAVDLALRALARRDGKSLNEAAIEALARALGYGAEPIRFRSLEELTGTWQPDDEFDAALAEQHRIDEFPWR
ncbi:MAG: hypothetical protein O7I93_10085 [Gemmatimonadetes bacterium]|nr:hypothetical protein [Gemmatimonadota bacterium]